MPHVGNRRGPARRRVSYDTQTHLTDPDGTAFAQNEANKRTVARPESRQAPLYAEREKFVIPLVGVGEHEMRLNPTLNPNLIALNDAISRYNSVNDFSPLSKLSSKILAQRTLLRAKLESARAALFKTVTEIDSITRDLHRAAASDSSRLPFLNQHEHWYEQGNLLALSEDDICNALEAHPPTDAAYFAHYVRCRITECIDVCAREASNLRLRATHPGPAWYWKVDPDPAFARKALRLICMLLYIETDGLFYAFQELVWAKANILRLDWYLPVTLAEIETLGNAVDTIIETLLNAAHHAPVARRRTSFEPGLLDLPRIPVKTAVFYNVAQASHMLDTAWEKRECESLDPAFRMDITDNRAKSVGGCWHAYNEHLTEMLNGHAYEEIHLCVYVATAHLLPAELVEVVLEFALLLEGMSINYEVRDPETGRTKAKYVEWCRFISE
ncbi:hypothetical protein LTR56_018005 [Elasticomyces elasticus]|nr:hypothetical protein LTR56_018005 [Elasticomyces elasticus]KAK3663340.1 hypothetical protein LTR22_005747 [Elasticomyces elasticus]KAK4925419.1 hypothetical protein LTR49_007483 [Elasticomyces elasticus]KAK5764514.1 hypothetical protein LTS12_005244 [Elasticomyces elasticus]